jgi:AcrR family transcriptional regulator
VSTARDAVSAASTRKSPERPRWRSRTADRATQDLRKRAELRSDQFLAVALELLSEGGADNLSVRKIVEMSGMSLRSFYQLFGGRDDLFLAIYEEAIVGGLERQMAAVDQAGDDPFGRIRAFFEAEWFETERSSPKLRRSLVIYHQRLMETRPAELAAVLEPQLNALTELVADCRAAGSGNLRLDDATTAAIMMQLMITTLQNRVLEFSVQESAIDVDHVLALVEPIFVPDRA